MTPAEQALVDMHDGPFTADLLSPSATEWFDEDPMDVHTWFNLTYANYAVLHRTVLQSMPIDWQLRFVRCMREMEDIVRAAGVELAPGYMVKAQDPTTGRFVSDPIPHYSRGRARVDLTPKEKHGTDDPKDDHPEGPTTVVVNGDMAVELPGIEPDKVIDLMAALERSVSEAKAARKRHPQPGTKEPDATQ